MLCYITVAIALIFVIGEFLFQKWPWSSWTKGNAANTAKARTDKEGIWPPPIIPLLDLTPETLPERHATPWRPYKPTEYRLTMGLSALEPSQWIQIDNGYPERMAKRKALIEKYPTVVYGFKPEMVPAIEELYEYLLGYYLPRRYPGLFRISLKKGLGLASEESWFENLVTRECHPIIPPTRSALAKGSKRAQAVDYLLRAIATTIEEDFLMLLPDSLLPNEGKVSDYIMRAFCVCFPSGFNASGFLGKPLAAIHTPVPGYKERLQMSMDRFFGRVMVGRLWRRWNWTVTTHNGLCVPHGNELYETEVPKPMENSDPAQAQLRVEYQTLTRLPNTQALVFTIRTYLTPLGQIRNEPPPVHAGTEEKPEPGYGTPNGRGGPEDLADAIEGIKGPMMEYKNFHIFNERVVRYLRTGEK
ncbi:hypothetical protein L211DRAFT_841075 [Terfezia boudieri ATCC MYA-4762]|uniref:HRQ family protein n=1 Tax=Terfezia boudieri ATCC MYA-4762 TaxID=1051890 RepID=A0A3N4LDX5_9PEZI|nr:hypothetical protein L211DRAFT_841075 [Terfezia boudieri ATCC MYA-4762]